jgi:hypothetical protein
VTPGPYLEDPHHRPPVIPAPYAENYKYIPSIDLYHVNFNPIRMTSLLSYSTIVRIVSNFIKCNMTCPWDEYFHSELHGADPDSQWDEA